MSPRFCGVTAWMRASSEITAALSKMRPDWKELEYAARTRAQSANMRHACRRHAGCAAWIEGASRATGGATLRIRRGLRVSSIRYAQRREALPEQHAARRDPPPAPPRFAACRLLRK